MVEREPSVKRERQGIALDPLIVPHWQTSKRFEPWFFMVALITFIRSIKRLMQTRADLYHASDLTALPASYIAAQLRHKPLIFEDYELHWPTPYTGVSFWRVLGGLFVRLLALLLPQCAGVIT